MLVAGKDLTIWSAPISEPRNVVFLADPRGAWRRASAVK
jgi:hypothetical protein